MTAIRTFVVALLAVILLAGVLANTSEARAWEKKGIWGPVVHQGKSQFGIYRRMGAKIYMTSLAWSRAAPRRPQRATDPGDPAYRWPAELDVAVREARRHRMRLMVNVTQAPGWANGARPQRYAPGDSRDYARFLTAAARRYRGVRLWQVWSEPSRVGSFSPMANRRDVQRYAVLLERAYRALKGVRRRNLVIGGNTFVTGDVVALTFLKHLKLPNGRRPRFDLYGHNPFARRRPRLSDPPLGHGFVDFGTLDTLAKRLDRYYPRRRGRRRIKLFLSEYTVPTGRRSHVFNFGVRQATAASWLRSAMRIARRWRRIYALGWYRLYDDPPGTPRGPAEIGLLDWRGHKKPVYWAYRRG